MWLCRSTLLVAVLFLVLQILSQHKVSADESLELEDSEETSWTIGRILELSRNCTLHFGGTETERVQLSDLKSDLEIWQKLLVDLCHGIDWEFPNTLRVLNSTNMKLHQWRVRMYSVSFVSEKTLLAVLEDQRLASQEVRWAKPDQRLVERAVRVVTELHEVWATVSIKFAEAVATNFSDINERIFRTREVFDLYNDYES